MDTLNLHAVAKTAASRLPVSPSPADEAWRALLGELGAAELAGLRELALLRRLPAGAPVFGRGDLAPGLFAVLEGPVGLGQATADASGFQLERSVRGPAWLDLASAWLPEGHALDARTLGPAWVAELPLPALRRLMLRHPALAERLVRALAQTVRELGAVTHDLMHKDAEKRLAAWLLQQARGLTELRLGERKRDIAAQLAITPETLSRMMRQLKLKGLIAVAGYAVQLLDPAGLQELAGAD